MPTAPATRNAMPSIEDIENPFLTRGEERYADEPVSRPQPAPQTRHLAKHDGVHAINPPLARFPDRARRCTTCSS